MILSSTLIAPVSMYAEQLPSLASAHCPSPILLDSSFSLSNLTGQSSTLVHAYWTEFSLSPFVQHFCFVHSCWTVPCFGLHFLDILLPSSNISTPVHFYWTGPFESENSLTGQNSTWVQSSWTALPSDPRPPQSNLPWTTPWFWSCLLYSILPLLPTRMPHLPSLLVGVLPWYHSKCMELVDLVRVYWRALFFFPFGEKLSEKTVGNAA